MALNLGTPRQNSLVAEIDGQRYLVLTDAQGARTWMEEPIPDQDVPDEEEFAIDLSDFSQGSGFSYEGIPGTYDWANGWDASNRRKPATWPQAASGQSLTVDYDGRGWQFYAGNFLYVARGRYIIKYTPDATLDSTWAITEIHDLGSGTAIAGRPVIFKGKVYVPRVTTSTNATTRFHELTTIVTTVAEVQTIAITGTPTSGTYTITYDGKTTAAIAYNAPSTDVQAALRLLPGLQLVTVVQSGSAPNYTHTVTMTGVGGGNALSSPAQMTSTDSTSGGTHTITHATTVAGTVDTWTLGPASSGSWIGSARCFRVWAEELVAGDTNKVQKVTADPMTAANWGPQYEVGDSTSNVTDMAVHPDVGLIVGKTDGLYSFDQNSNVTNELPDLKHITDDANCIGMEYTNGYIIVPHKGGTVRWRPGAYEVVGPEQEGYLEADISRGWGRVQGVAPAGPSTYYAVNDFLHTRAALGLFRPQKSNDTREPLIPHMLQGIDDATFEHVVIMTLAGEPVGAHSFAVAADDNAVGTITWSNPSNALAVDGSAATAAVGTSHYLKLTNAGTAIPSSATITGVLVEIKRSEAP